MRCISRIKLFALAGLWNVWYKTDCKKVKTSPIIATEPNHLFNSFTSGP